MKRFPLLGALALAAGLAGCDGSQATASSGEPGALAVALPARVLQTVSIDSDSLRVILYGPSDTLWSVARLTDTLRFDGLRAGWWTVQADLFSNDSGPRDRHWTGSAGTYVEPGRTARVGLVLRRATGSLIVDISLEDDDWADTAAWPDTGAWYPPVDTGIWYSGDSARWIDSVRRADSIYRSQTGWTPPTPPSGACGLYDPQSSTSPYLDVRSISLPRRFWDTVATAYASAPDTAASSLCPPSLDGGPAVIQGTIRFRFAPPANGAIPYVKLEHLPVCEAGGPDTACGPVVISIQARMPSRDLAPERVSQYYTDLWVDLSRTPEAYARGVVVLHPEGYQSFVSPDLLSASKTRFEYTTKSPTGAWFLDSTGIRRPMIPS
jgi:hypothetical protein